MRIFKNKTLSRILSALLIVALIIGMDYALGYLLEPVTYSTYFKRDIKELEESGTRADVVFVGASRTLYTFAPKIFEDEWGLDCVINAGSEAQPISGTYYQLKDMIERMHPDKVYIGMTLDLLLKDSSLEYRLVVLDRLSLKNKIPFALSCFSPKETIYFFKSYRYNDQPLLQKILDNVYIKTHLDETISRLYEGTANHYVEKGYVFLERTWQSGTIPIKVCESFSDEKIVPDKLKYLDACIELCKKNNIDVTLVTGVTSVMRMYVNEGYQDANDYYKNYAEKNGIKYYNLNYMKDRETLIPDELMYDYNHTNGEGAMVASKFLANVVKAEEAGEDTSQYFYANLDEFKKTVKRIVAVGAEIQPDEERDNLLHISITSLQNDDVSSLYRVSIYDYFTKECYKSLDWTSESEIELEINDAARSARAIYIMIEAAAEDPSYGTARQAYIYDAVNKNIYGEQ